MEKQTLEQEYEALFKKPAYNLKEGKYNILYVGNTIYYISAFQDLTCPQHICCFDIHDLTCSKYKPLYFGYIIDVHKTIYYIINIL